MLTPYYTSFVHREHLIYHILYIYTPTKHKNPHVPSIAMTVGQMGADVLFARRPCAICAHRPGDRTNWSPKTRPQTNSRGWAHIYIYMYIAKKTRAITGENRPPKLTNHLCMYLSAAFHRVWLVYKASSRLQCSLMRFELCWSIRSTSAEPNNIYIYMRELYGRRDYTLLSAQNIERTQPPIIWYNVASYVVWMYRDRERKR